MKYKFAKFRIGIDTVYNINCNVCITVIFYTIRINILFLKWDITIEI